MLGKKLRDARRERKMTLKDVAAGAEISEGHLSKIENGKTVPSLPLLHRIARVLGINLALLFDDTAGQDRPVSRAGERPLIALDPLRKGSGVTLERIIAHSRNNALQCNIHIMEPGGSSDGQINHEGEEVGFVIEGEVELHLDDTTYLLHEGDTFHFKSHRPHGYRNAGPTRARIFWVNTPPTF
ncbi:MAG: cupin domain-containing protein [Gemmobacter sp.]